MRRIWLAGLIGVLWSAFLPSAVAGDVSGKWGGPWYRGMTSGTMTLQVQADGSGVVQFTNLDGFGEQAVALSRSRIDGTRLDFSAAGEGAGVFVASTQLTGDGEVLEGKGEYDGFPIKFKLKRR